MGNGLIERKFFKNVNLIVIFILTIFQVLTRIRPLYRVEIYTMFIAAFFALAWISSKSWIVTLKKYLIVFFAFSLIMYLLDTARGGFEFKEYIAEIFSYGMWTIIFIYAIETYERKQLVIFATIIVIAINISSISTATTLATNPEASRFLAGHSDDILLRSGVGGYGFIYGLVFLNYGLLIALKRTKKNYVKAGIIITLAINYYTILFSSYSTAILFSLVLLVFAAMQSEKSSTIKNILLWGIVIIVYFFRIEIISFIKEMGESLGLDWIVNRMGQLVDAMETGDYEDLRRIRLYEESFESFMAHPMTGGGIDAPRGGHSTGLDLLAQYGIWGAIFLLVNITGLKMWNVFSKKNAHIYFLITYVVFININTCMSIEIPCSVFFVCPLIIYLFSDADRNLSETNLE